MRGNDQLLEAKKQISLAWVVVGGGGGGGAGDSHGPKRSPRQLNDPSQVLSRGESLVNSINPAQPSCSRACHKSAEIPWLSDW